MTETLEIKLATLKGATLTISTNSKGEERYSYNSNNGFSATIGSRESTHDNSILWMSVWTTPRANGVITGAEIEHVLQPIEPARTSDEIMNLILKNEYLCRLIADTNAIERMEAHAQQYKVEGFALELECEVGDVVYNKLMGGYVCTNCDSYMKATAPLPGRAV